MKKFLRKRHVHHTHAAINLSTLKKKHSCNKYNYSSDSLSQHRLCLVFCMLTALLPLLMPPNDAYLNAIGNAPIKERNRFQKFFHKLAIRIERACLSIENKNANLRAYRNDF